MATTQTLRLLALLLVALLSAGLLAQDAPVPTLELRPMLRVDGPQVRVGERWGLTVGAAVSFIGDVDDDGISDLAIGSSSPYSQGDPGTLRLHSGKDGSFIRKTEGRGTGFGSSLCRVGDIDGDGHADVLVGDILYPTVEPWPGVGAIPGPQPGRGQVMAYSGADLTLLWLRDLGTCAPRLAAVPDLDGDGVDDALVAGPEGGGLLALLGRDGSSLYACTPDHLGLGDTGAISIAVLGDVDGDGLGDALLGSGSGRATVVSGADGHTLYTLQGRGVPWERFGWTVAALGDVNADGIPDGAIGSSRGGQDRTRKFQSDGAPWVRVFSGSDGAKLAEFDIQTALHGTRIGASGDVDGDGVPDLVTGGASTLEVHSVADGRVIARRHVMNPDFPGGWPGYGHKTLGQHCDCHDHPGDFLVVATNFWGEGFIEVFDNDR